MANKQELIDKPLSDYKKPADLLGEGRKLKDRLPC